jgi:hypothetical protein
MSPKQRRELLAKIWSPKREPLKARIERLERIREYRQQNPDARPRGWHVLQERQQQNA